MQGQDPLREEKIKERISNEDYLLKHPEIQRTLTDLYNKLLVEKPNKDEVFEFIVDYFMSLSHDYIEAMG